MDRTPLRMLVAGLSVVILGGLSAHTIAHYDQAQLNSIEIDSYSPSPVPDRIILSLVGDPATEMGVNWRTDNNAEVPLAQIAISDGSPSQADRATTITGSTQTLNLEHYQSFHHSVHFTQLLPDTLYIYRVGDGQIAGLAF